MNSGRILSKIFSLLSRFLIEMTRNFQNEMLSQFNSCKFKTLFSLNFRTSKISCNGRHLILNEKKKNK